MSWNITLKILLTDWVARSPCDCQWIGLWNVQVKYTFFFLYAHIWYTQWMLLHNHFICYNVDTVVSFTRVNVSSTSRRMTSLLLWFAHQDKCFQYWPEKGCWMYGNVRVAMEDFTVLVDYTIRKFCVQYVSKISKDSYNNINDINEECIFKNNYQAFIIFKHTEMSHLSQHTLC